MPVRANTTDRAIRAIATYQRVSSKEQANNSDAFTRQGWELDQEAAKYPDRVRLHFSDIQSGKRDDRPDFMRLIAAIAADKIDLLIVTRIDRIGRNLTSNSQLQELLESKGVQVYEILKDEFLNWNNPNSWAYFCQAGLNGEMESRMLSARIRKARDYYRAQGKLGIGGVGFPYRRDVDGWLIPDPDKWEIAVKAIEIVINHQGATMPAIGEIRHLGLDRTRVWLSNWIRSPLIRGHIPIDTYGSGRVKKPRSQWRLFENSHPSLFDDPRLEGCEQLIDRIIEDSARYKGKARSRTIHGLSGLIWCDRCGHSCYVKTSANPRYPSDKRYYASCSQRLAKGVNCGGEYGVFNGERKSVNTRYPDIELAVQTALIDRASELVDLAIASTPKPTQIELPEITKLRSDIDRLTAFNDPDLASAIAKKTEQLNRLLLLASNPDIDTDRRQRFIDLFKFGSIFANLTELEKHSIYRDWILRVDVDRDRIVVRLAI